MHTDTRIPIIKNIGVTRMSIKVDKVIDAKGLACPMPIVRAKNAINELDSGQVLEIHATDQGSTSDITAWAKSGGHDLLQHTEEDDVFKFWIKKG